MAEWHGLLSISSLPLLVPLALLLLAAAAAPRRTPGPSSTPRLTALRAAAAAAAARAERCLGGHAVLNGLCVGLGALSAFEVGCAG
jgi:hypothetical protein